MLVQPRKFARPKRGAVPCRAADRDVSSDSNNVAHVIRSRTTPHAVLGVLVGAYLLCYLDRMVMASAIPFIAKDFHLSPLAMGEVLSAFFVGYTIMQIPGGVLADRFGPRAVLTASIGWWSIMTALSGMAPALLSLLAVRALFGLGEGPYPSAASKAVAISVPERQAGRAVGVQQSATMVGATLAPLFVVSMVEHHGWRSVFYALFFPGMALAVLTWLVLKNSVTTQSNTGPNDGVAPVKGLKRALQSPAVLWCAGCLFLLNVVSWGLLNWLPTYFLQARGFSLDKMGVFTAITNIGGAIGYLLGGYLCDRHFSRRLHLLIMIGSIVSGSAIYLAARTGSGEWAVAFLTLVFLFGNVAGAAIFTLPLVIVPKEAVGSAFGVVNTAGQLAGVLAPVSMGYVLNATHGNFELVLFGLVALSFLAIYPAGRIRQPALLAPAL